MNILDRYDIKRPDTPAERIVFRVMDALGDRSGFDHWWYNIDADIRNDILDELCQAVESELNAE